MRTKKAGTSTIRYIIFIFIGLLAVSTAIPVKHTIETENLPNGYICVVEQTTGPWWRVVQIVEDNVFGLAENELVYLKGFNPYTKMSWSAIMSFMNPFYIRVSDVNVVYPE